MLRISAARMAIATAIILAGAACFWLLPAGQPPAKVEATTASALTFGGPFELVDHAGRTVTDQDFKGRHLLIFFGFTSCPAICPMALQKVSDALQELGPGASRLTPLFISLDPEHDTPEVMADYIKNFDNRIVGLTGTAAQIDKAAKAYHIFYRRVRDAEGSEQIEHTATFFLMAADGSYLAHIPPEVSPKKMAFLIQQSIRSQSVAATRSTPL